MNKPYIIGIDPGFTGAVAVLDTATMKCVAVEDIPVYRKVSKFRKSGEMSHVDVHKLAMIIDAFSSKTAIAVIEEVGAMPRQGLSSTFRFGYAAGECHGVLAANYIPTIPIKPSVWKPALGLSGDKQNSIDMARKHFVKSDRFFRFKKHHDRAEAALMAFYATKYLTGMIDKAREPIRVKGSSGVA